jgi:hypothetical protein
MEPLPTVDIPDVEILSVGGPYHGHGSPPEGDYLDERFLRERVRDTRALLGIIEPPLKLGHHPEQRVLKVSGLAEDGKPAAGWIDPATMRVEGGRILATLRRVPRKLARLIASGAWRKVSAEWDRVRVGDREYVPILGLSLLGADLPANWGLDDVIRLYAEDRDPGERHFAERDADERLYAAAQSALDHDEEVVVDKELRAALGLPEDASEEQVRAAVSELRRGAEVATGLREALGVRDGESLADAIKRRDQEAEDRRKADLDALRAELATKPADGGGDEESDAVQQLRAELEERDRKHAEELAAVREEARAGVEVAAEMRAMARRELIESALRDGRIRPADREDWEKDLEQDFELASRMLSRLSPDPVLAREYGSGQHDESAEARRSEEERRYEATMRALGFDRIPSVQSAA